MPPPALPPEYQLVALDPEIGAFARAVRAAPRGIEDGTLYWTDRPDRLDLALIREPEGAASQALQGVYLLSLAAADSLSHRLPPGTAVALAWPGDILLAGRRAGRVRAAVAAETEGAAPWLVLGLTIEALGAEVPILLAEVAASLHRQTRAWLESGLAPVREKWNQRCYRLGQPSVLALGDGRIEGVVGGLDQTGSLVIGEHRLALDEALDLLR